MHGHINTVGADTHVRVSQGVNGNIGRADSSPMPYHLPKTVRVWVLRALWPQTSKTMRIEADTLEEAKAEAEWECKHTVGGQYFIGVEFVRFDEEVSAWRVK